jgi:uncharacterized protein (TIGR03083 family)
VEQDPRVLIATLRASHDRLASLVAALTPEQLRGPSYCADWSVAQVLSHIGSAAEIGLMMSPAALRRGEAPGPESFGPIWDAWNAKSPDAQAADGLSADEKYVRALEGLSDDDLAAISFPVFGLTLDAAGLVRLRLGEHAMHTWDVAVAADPGARVAPDAIGLLIDNVPGFIAPRLGRAPDEPFRIHIRTTDPERDYLLIAADPVGMPDWPGDGAAADGEVRMPAEALLRLAYGRLDPGHTPAGVQGDAADLDRLRRVFPGF